MKPENSVCKKAGKLKIGWKLGPEKIFSEKKTGSKSIFINFSSISNFPHEPKNRKKIELKIIVKGDISGSRRLFEQRNNGREGAGKRGKASGEGEGEGAPDTILFVLWHNSAEGRQWRDQTDRRRESSASPPEDCWAPESGERKFRGREGSFRGNWNGLKFGMIERKMGTLKTITVEFRGKLKKKISEEKLSKSIFLLIKIEKLRNKLKQITIKLEEFWKNCTSSNFFQFFQKFENFQHFSDDFKEILKNCVDWKKLGEAKIL